MVTEAKIVLGVPLSVKTREVPSCEMRHGAPGKSLRRQAQTTTWQGNNSSPPLAIQLVIIITSFKMPIN
jgi:hypothetical protein